VHYSFGRVAAEFPLLDLELWTGHVLAWMQLQVVEVRHLAPAWPEWQDQQLQDQDKQDQLMVHKGWLALVDVQSWNLSIQVRAELEGVPSKNIDQIESKPIKKFGEKKITKRLGKPKKWKVQFKTEGTASS